MAHITSIRIDGLLGRKDTLSFNLERDVNVFFGDNGCGKTTLLKIMNAALDRNAEVMENLAVEKAEVNIFSIAENKVIKHTWERKHNKRTLNMESLFDSDAFQSLSLEDISQIRGRSNPNEWKLSPTPKEIKPNSKKWAHTFLPTTRLYLGDSVTRNPRPSTLQISETQLDSMFAEAINRSWLRYYAQTLQSVRLVQESGLRAVLHNVLNSGPQKKAKSNPSEKETYERVKKFLSRQPDTLKLGTFETFTQKYRSDENLRRTVDNLDDVEKKIEQTMVPIESFKLTVQKLFSGGKTITTTDNQIQVILKSGDSLSISNLSSGEKHLIKILFEAMTADSNSILIDEPELSMHIDWQRIFIQTVQSLNPNCQLILASHSPEIMAEIDDKKIFKL